MKVTPLSTWQNTLKLTGWASSSGRQVLPEDCVVDVSSAIELQCRAQADDRAYTVCNNLNVPWPLNFQRATKLHNQVLQYEYLTLILKSAL
jgi:hypothetical protein